MYCLQKRDLTSNGTNRREDGAAQQRQRQDFRKEQLLLLRHLEERRNMHSVCHVQPAAIAVYAKADAGGRAGDADDDGAPADVFVEVRLHEEPFGEDDEERETDERDENDVLGQAFCRVCGGLDGVPQPVRAVACGIRREVGEVTQAEVISRVEVLETGGGQDGQGCGLEGEGGRVSGCEDEECQNQLRDDGGESWKGHAFAFEDEIRDVDHCAQVYYNAQHQHGANDIEVVS